MALPLVLLAELDGCGFTSPASQQRLLPAHSTSRQSPRLGLSSGQHQPPPSLHPPPPPTWVITTSHRTCLGFATSTQNRSCCSCFSFQIRKKVTILGMFISLLKSSKHLVNTSTEFNYRRNVVFLNVLQQARLI